MFLLAKFTIFQKLSFFVKKTKGVHPVAENTLFYAYRPLKKLKNTYLSSIYQMNTAYKKRI